MFLQEFKDILDRVLGDRPADSDLLGVGGGNHHQRVVGKNADTVDLEPFPIQEFFLNVLDDCQTLIGIDDPIPNLEGVH